MFNLKEKRHLIFLITISLIAGVFASVTSVQAVNLKITSATLYFTSGNNRFLINGKIDPGSIDLDRDNLTIQVGSYSETINAGSFVKKGKKYIYEAEPGFFGIAKMILDSGKKSFSVNGSGVDLSGTVNPVDVYINIGDSYSECATVKMKVTKKGKLWKFKGKSKECTGTVFNPEAGGTLSTADGAKVDFPSDFGTGNIAAVFTKTSDATGEEKDDKKEVSGVYRLTIAGAESVKSNLTVSIPVDESMLPQGWKEDALQPEYFDESTGKWVPDGDFVFYDSEAKTVSFNVSVSGSVSEAPLLALNAPAVGQADSVTQKFKRDYRITIYSYSHALSVTSPDSNFNITYYPSVLNFADSIKTNSAWNSTTGNAVDANIPDFIEDLMTALDNAYEGMLSVSRSTGDAVFSPLSTPQEVTVRNCGESAGQSALGGPLTISNSRIEGWDDMKGVSAHELVHVFQSQYYVGGITGGWLNYLFQGNRWFIEATANYYAALVNGFNDEQKKKFFAKDGYEDYLIMPITSPSEGSMYAAGHFLDWLSIKYSTTIVGDALAKGGTRDLTNLSEALKDNGVSGGIGEAFKEFGAYLISTPDGYDKFNKQVKDKMADLAKGYNYASANIFTDTRHFITLKRTLKPLSMSYLKIDANNSSDALLVIDSTKTSGTSLTYYTYDFAGSTNNDYQGKTLWNNL